MSNHFSWNRLSNKYTRVAALGMAIAAGAWALAGSRGGSSEVSGGMSAVLAAARTQPPLSGEILSPSGKAWEVGRIDELGYRLPLDVLYRDGSKRGKLDPRRGNLEPDRDHPKADRDTEEGGPLNPSWSNPGTSTLERSRLAPGDHDAIDRRSSHGGFPWIEHRLGPDDGHTENETSIDAEGSTVVAGWNQFVDGSLDMGVARSTDAGQTWSWSALGGHTVTSDPAVKSGGDGRWYYAYLAQGGPGGNDIDIYVRRSTDDGATWSAPVDASRNGSFDDKPYIAARGNEVLVGWADFGTSPAKIRTSRSTDGGLTFGTSTILSVNSNSGNGACPVIAPDGDYYMFWRDSFQDSLWMSRSTNQGVNWSPDRGIVAMNPLPSTLPGGFRIVNLPSAAAHPFDGDLLVVWNDQALGNPDILAVRSADDGATWSDPVRVNDDAGSAAQWFPWVDFDDNGMAHVVWYDRRHDAMNIDVYVTQSVDAGQTFNMNVRVTGQSFPPVLPWDSSVDFIGDYNGIAATSLTVYPFYQDARRGEQDVYVALLPNETTSVPEVPALSSGITASPNPFRERISFRIDPSAAGTESMFHLYDAAGRLVRSLAVPSADDDQLAARDDAADSPAHRGAILGTEVLWDGRDHAGREVPAGAYYGKLSSSDPNASGRTVRVTRLQH